MPGAVGARPSNLAGFKQVARLTVWHSSAWLLKTRTPAGMHSGQTGCMGSAATAVLSANQHLDVTHICPPVTKY